MHRLQVDRYVPVGEVLAGEIDHVPGERLHEHVVGLDIHRRRKVVIDAEIIELMWRGAAADADLEASAAEVIEHADLFGEPERVMRGQHIDQRAQTNPPRALRDRRKEHVG